MPACARTSGRKKTLPRALVSKLCAPLCINVYMWLIMINPQKPVINLINIFNRFTALIYIYIYMERERTRIIFPLLSYCAIYGHDHGYFCCSRYCPFLFSAAKYSLRYRTCALCIFVKRAESPFHVFFWVCFYLNCFIHLQIQSKSHYNLNYLQI